MKTKTIEYGTQHNCEVISATEKLIVVVGDDGEGYVLMYHGLKALPVPGDKGKITFVKSTGPMKGHWQYSASR